jgi:membrane protein
VPDPRPNLIEELRETGRLTRLAVWRSVVEMYDSEDFTFAASIGYYALLSLFPVLLIIISILGSVASTEANRVAVMRFVLTYFPRQFDFIVQQLDAFTQTPIRLGIGGGLALVWASLGVFNAISAAVNHAWGVEKKRNFWQHRLFSFLMLVVAGLLLMAVLLTATAVQVVEARWFANYHWTSPQLIILRGYTVRYATLLLPAFIFGLIYYFVPNVTDVLVKDVWLGALITGLLWDVGLKGFAWFVRDTSRWTHIHGNIATVVVFLLWIYVSAIILLWGVEFTAAYAKMRRDLRVSKAGARYKNSSV